jgi:hypothetical protein
VGSGELLELVAPIAGGDIDLAKLDGACARLDAHPYARALVQAAGAANLVAADLALDSARRLAGNGSYPAEVAAATLTAAGAFVRAVEVTAVRIRVDERVLVSDALRRTLASENYTLDEAKGVRSQAFIGRRGHEVLGVLVHDGGAVDIDVAGLADGACVDTIENIQAGLARHGIELATMQVRDHGDPHGGVLLAPAGAAATEHGTSLVHGVIRQHEVGVATTSTASGASPGSRRQRARARQ